MKVIRSDTKLLIEIEDDNDGIEIEFPNVARFHYGLARYEVIADDLEYILSKIDHYLAVLASNALAAELYAEMTGRPRWLVYDAKNCSSYDTPHFTEGAPKVEFENGKVVWSN